MSENLMAKLTPVTLPLTLLLFANSVTANDEQKKWYSGYTITVGITNHQMDMEVWDLDSEDTYGTLTTGNSIQPSFSLKTRFNRIYEDSGFGFYMEYGFDRFQMKDQLLGQEGTGAKVDLGTRATGYLFHATPTLVWNLQLSNHQFGLGLGIGLGYLNMKGDIVYTEQAGQPLHHFDISDFDMSIGLLAYYQYKHLFLDVRDFGPAVSHGGYEYMIYDMAFDVRYTFTF